MLVLMPRSPELRDWGGDMFLLLLVLLALPGLLLLVLLASPLVLRVLTTEGALARLDLENGSEGRPCWIPLMLVLLIFPKGMQIPDVEAVWLCLLDGLDIPERILNEFDFSVGV